MAQQTVKPGLTSGAVKVVPDEWSSHWLRRFITNFLAGADVRNAIGANGVKITGNITTPYATISLTSPLTLNPATTTTTAPAAGGAGALPATPAGYVTVNINGVNRQIAFY
jgi:hypothetical protein